MELRDVGDTIRAPEVPVATRRLLTALAEGRAGRAFPPVVVPGPEGTLAVERPLGGPSDARALVHALSDPRFAPLHEVLRRIDAWSARVSAETRQVEPELLRAENADLFGPLITETLEACVAGPAERAAAFAAERVGQYLEFLILFLERLARDQPADRRVTGLWANGAETHNGGQRVLRVEFADGGRLAYKPRPATGELLFLAAEGSVFALLNQLPPAAGEIMLPTMGVRQGSGPDRPCYSWQEWIEPPGTWGVLRAAGPLSLRGAVLEPEAAGRYWHRAGSLAAAAFAFGITDLIGGNVLIGQRPEESEPLPYPVDLESYFGALDRLFETGLMADPAVSAHHHAGLENTPRWCELDGPATCWRPQPDGSLRLERRSRSLTRTETRSVVGDTEGRVGYGPYLPSLLRGMFDAWVLMCRNRARIAEFIGERAAGHVVRVIARPTAEYPDGGDTPFTGSESAQLARGDVPYFFRAADGGPLLAMRMPPGRELRADPAEAPEWGEGRPRPPVAAVREGGKLDLAGLGIALRDAVEYAHDTSTGPGELHDPGNGVRLTRRGPREGEVSFDWPQAGRRVTYSWDEAKLRLRIDPLTEAAGPVEPAGQERESGTAPKGGPAARTGAEIRERLLRFGRLDSALRGPWAAGGFTDTELEARLERLTGAGIAWLRGVVAEHGWPGHGLVGPEAATVAAALLQHHQGDLDFRRACLTLIEAAAEAGDMLPRDAAYLTDALRRAEGRPQLYGTKFERAATGELRPCPIEDEDRVDERRAAAGLQPLAAYAALLAEKYPAPEPAAENEGVRA
ncbi:DUF4135 domain-containing protein [Streptomyces sp. TRM68416]|uniref:DUF4135 domain-containing protein n=1 Tax=Streptomyces sp. TRM68416 TaxID=2758412 RepID=UPI001662056F|nr:DUF4135 domain-containing protein [Streptomyces sp. TRM68416]MBD0838560.1 type 2 lantipeptide synthetase LanM [Streptomyces sp. TRM68416]